MIIIRAASCLFILSAAFLVEAQKGKDNGALRMSLSGKPWTLQVDAQGYKVKVNETKPDGRRYLVADNDGTGVTLSITLEQVRGAASLDDCRKVFRARNKGNESLHPIDVTESQVGEMAVSEFIFPEVNGIQLNQKNVFGCLAKEDVYVDIHLSKVQYRPEDQRLFLSILQAVHFTDANSAAAPASSMAYFAEGSKYFISQQFDKAISPYRKAFDLEKVDSKLERKLWYVLIDNLGMAYGITGDLKSAEEVFVYGISKSPEYPLFYYNLACTYAERKDLDGAMKYLTLAFERKQNVLPGEHMPDPSKDDSFQRFMGDKNFRKLIASF